MVDAQRGLRPELRVPLRSDQPTDSVNRSVPAGAGAVASRSSARDPQPYCISQEPCRDLGEIRTHDPRLSPTNAKSSSFTVPAGAPFVVTVNAVIPGAGGAADLLSPSTGPSPPLALPVDRTAGPAEVRLRWTPAAPSRLCYCVGAGQ